MGCFFVESSAKTDVGVTEAFTEVVKRILVNTKGAFFWITCRLALIAMQTPQIQVDGARTTGEEVCPAACRSLAGQNMQQAGARARGFRFDLYTIRAYHHHLRIHLTRTNLMYN